MFFCEAKRSELKEKNPEMKVTQLAKLLAEQWKSLSETDKQPFIVEAEKDKERYLKEKAKH